MRARFVLHHCFLALSLLALVGLSACSGPGVPEMVKGLEPGTYAWFDTTHGEFVARIFAEKAPRTAANFIGLAEGSKQYQDPVSKEWVTGHFYDGLIFHRVIDGFMIQGGCPLGIGTGNAGYKFADEFHPDLRHNKPGILSMALAAPDQNSSQFFITLAPRPTLDNVHSIFGEVVRGMDAVVSIGKTATHMQNRPIRNAVMKHVRIYRIGEDGQVGAPEKADEASGA